MKGYRLLLVAWCMSLVAVFHIQPASAQIANSDQTQILTNDQTFNQVCSNFTFGGSVPLMAFPFPGESPLPPFLAVPPHFARGESGYASKPWLRVQFFQERPVLYGVIPKAASKPPAAKPEAKKPANDIEEALKKAKPPTVEEGVLGVKEVTPPTPPARR